MRVHNMANELFKTKPMSPLTAYHKIKQFKEIHYPAQRGHYPAQRGHYHAQEGHYHAQEGNTGERCQFLFNQQPCVVCLPQVTFSCLNQWYDYMSENTLCALSDNLIRCILLSHFPGVKVSILVRLMKYLKPDTTRMLVDKIENSPFTQYNLIQAAMDYYEIHLSISWFFLTWEIWEIYRKSERSRKSRRFRGPCGSHGLKKITTLVEIYKIYSSIR